MKLVVTDKEKEEQTDPNEELSLEEIIKQNKENDERVKKDRVKDNQSVTRSYRLKK